MVCRVCREVGEGEELYLLVVILEKSAGDHLELEVALGGTHKHPQLVALVPRRHGQVGAQIEVVLHVLQTKEEPTNGRHL